MVVPDAARTGETSLRALKTTFKLRPEGFRVQSLQHLVPIKHVAGLRLDLTVMRKKLVKMKRLGVFLGGVGKSCCGGSVFRGKTLRNEGGWFPKSRPLRIACAKSGCKQEADRLGLITYFSHKESAWAVLKHTCIYKPVNSLTF